MAQRMGLPLARVELMLHRALRAIPLVADPDPVTVLPTTPCSSACMRGIGQIQRFCLRCGSDRMAGSALTLACMPAGHLRG